MLQLEQQIKQFEVKEIMIHFKFFTLVSVAKRLAAM
jgi:hypothetical protein